jgi:hypothetical protein
MDDDQTISNRAAGQTQQQRQESKPLFHDTLYDHGLPEMFRKEGVKVAGSFRPG